MAVMINAINNSVGNDFTVKSVTNDGASEVIQFNKSRAGGVITSGDSLGGIFFAGYDGSNNIVAARITSTSSGTIAAGRVAGNLVFSTHPDSVSAALTRLTINPTGAITIANPDSGTALTISGGGLNVTGTTVLNTPLGISSGGTNASSMANTYGVNYFDGTSIVTTAVGTATHVLTSNGPGVAPTFQAVAAGGVSSVTGTANQVTCSPTTGAVTVSLPSAITIPGNMTMQQGNSGGTVGYLQLGSSSYKAYSIASSTNFFINDGACIAAIGSNDTYNIGIGDGSLANLQNSTANYNVCLGYQSGNLIYNSQGNVGLGYQTLKLCSGSNNVALGYQALNTIQGTDNSKGYNIGIGYQAGTNQSGNINSNSNIYLNSPGGGSAESNTLRIGNGTGTSTQNINTAFISGIYNITVGATAGVAIVDSTDQIGTLSGTSSQVLFGGTKPAWKTASVLFAYTSVNNAASPYTVLSTDYYLSVDASGGAVTLRLPNAPTNYTTYIIKDRGGNAGTNNITVTTPGGAVNIDGATSFVMNTAYESITVLFNGTSYEIF